jgi:hypothetical protein
MIHDSQPFMLVKRFARKHKKALNIEKFNNMQKEQMIQLIEDNIEKVRENEVLMKEYDKLCLPHLKEIGKKERREKRQRKLKGPKSHSKFGDFGTDITPAGIAPLGGMLVGPNHPLFFNNVADEPRTPFGPPLGPPDSIQPPDEFQMGARWNPPGPFGDNYKK